MTRWSMLAWVVLFVLVGHVWSVGTGLYLDDHAHFQHLQRGDWSLRSAVEASRLGIVGQVIDLWGRRESGLLFFRPIAFWIMKTEYTLTGWDPAIMHGFMLAWHAAGAMLVGAMTMRFIGRRAWATVGACLFAIHPAHPATVYWIACQTELLATVFLLLGVLFYARHAGWPKNALLPPLELPGGESPVAGRPRAVTLWGLGAVLCYVLALGCRENALLFPAVCWLGDRLIGTGRRRWLRWEHVAMVVVAGVYLVLRWHMLGGFPLPARPYLMPVTDPDFPRFVLDKIAIYLAGLFLFVPIVPIGGQVFFRGHPLWLYGLAGAVVVLIGLVWVGTGRRRAVLWPLAWVACFLAPVMPVFASSHHLYLPSAGAAVLMAGGLAAMALRPPGSRTGAPLRTAAGAVVAVLAVGLPLVTWAQGFSYNRGTLVEDLVIEDVCRSPRPIRDGHHLFFFNMPIVAYYVTPALETKLGLSNLHGHMVTLAPDLLRMSTPGQVEVLDAHRLRLRCGEGHRYFEGITGHTFLQTVNLVGRIRAGEPIDAGLFTVTPVEADDRGVRELLLDFKDPLNNPEYHFFYGSPLCMAYAVDLAIPAPATAARP